MNETDTLYGIDRYKDSPMFGKLVVPEINLWKKSGSKGKIIGTLQHGTAVEIVDKDQVNNFMFCKVRGSRQRGTPITGWCRASLLKDAGESEFK